MNKKPFLIGFSAIFLVFSILLVNLAMTVYREEKARPLIYNCFVYMGDFTALEKRLEIESQYIDHFVILHSLRAHALEDHQRQALLKKYPQKAIFITVPNLPQESIAGTLHYPKPHFLKALGGCADRDILVFSNGEDVVEFQSLYQSLKKISKSPHHIFKLKASCEDSTPSNLMINAMSYNAYKQNLTPALQSKLKVVPYKTKKRRFFFLTTPQQKVWPCS